MVNLKINGISVSVPEGSTILQAAAAANVEIPTLCYLKGVTAPARAVCGVVEATARAGLSRRAFTPSAREWKYRRTRRSAVSRAR